MARSSRRGRRRGVCARGVRAGAGRAGGACRPRLGLPPDAGAAAGFSRGAGEAAMKPSLSWSGIEKREAAERIRMRARKMRRERRTFAVRVLAWGLLAIALSFALNLLAWRAAASFW